MNTLTNLSRLLALLWAGLIFHLSGQSSLDVPLLFPGQDKLLHALVFGLLGFLVLGGMRPAGKGFHPGSLLGAFLLVVLFGIVDEYHQSFVPGRTADPLDVLADAVGAIIGVGLMALIYRKLNRPRT
jgi:VanZ family protein